MRADGKPWTGARVFVFGRAGNLTPQARAERLEVRADERGRFRLRLAPAFEYVAWACAGEIPDGDAKSTEIARSDVVSRVVAGASIKLRESSRRLKVASFKVEGLAAWKSFGPLRFELRSTEMPEVGAPIEATAASSPDDDTDLLRFPALAFPATSFVVLSSAGRALAEARFTLARPLIVPRPFELGFSVLDTDKKSPLPGAFIMQPIDGVWRRIGETDEAGKCQTLPALLLNSRSSRFVAMPRRGSLTLSEKNITLERVNPGDPAKRADSAIDCLTNGKSLRGRLMVDEGTPAAGKDLRFFVSCPVKKGSWYHRREAFEVKSGDDGKFEIRGVPERCQWRLFYLDPSGKWPFTMLAAGSDVDNVDLGALRLDKLKRCDIEVFDASNAPAAYADALVGALPGSPGIGLYNEFPLRLNRRGRLSLRALDYEGLLFGALRDGEYRQVELVKLGESGRLLLQESCVVSGRVVDTKGEPIVGAEIWLRHHSNHGSSSMLSRFRLKAARPKSRADGSYRIKAVPGSKLSLSAFYSKRGASRKRSPSLELTVQEALHEVDDLVVPVQR